MKEDIEQKAEYLAKETYRDNPTDLKGVDYKYNTDINAPRKRKAFVKGYTAGATEERERGKRFAEWLFKNNLYFVNDDIFNSFLVEEKELNN